MAPLKAELKQEKAASARRYFARAAQSEKTRKDATAWLRIVDRKQEASTNVEANGGAEGAALGS